MEWACAAARGPPTDTWKDTWLAEITREGENSCC